MSETPTLKLDWDDVERLVLLAAKHTPGPEFNAFSNFLIERCRAVATCEKGFILPTLLALSPYSDWADSELIYATDGAQSDG